MVPLARALQARGHDLRWATGPESCARVEKAGIPAVTAGLTQAQRLGEFWRRHPETRALPQARWPDVMFPKMFGEISAAATLADLMPLMRSWRPEVVVHDAAELAAPIAAAALGVPNVTHAFGALLPEARVAAGAVEVAPLWRAHGLEARPYGGAYDHLYLDIYPPSLQLPGGDHVGVRQLLRPEPFDGEPPGPPLPSALGDGAAAPLVYLTFGTVFNDNEAFRAALAGIGGLGVRLVVTVGPDGDPTAFGRQPPHVTVERYLPQTVLLPSCDVVASHGGSGTVLACLGLGIPELCLPQAADQFLNAGAIARAGAGLVLPPDEVTAVAVATAVRRLLDDPAYGNRAGLVADEIAAMPSPDEVAGVVVALQA